MKTLLTITLLALTLSTAAQENRLYTSTDSTYTNLAENAHRELVYRDKQGDKFYFKRTFVKILKRVYIKPNSTLRKG